MRLSIPFLTAAAVLISTAASAQQIDWQKVDEALGRKPAVTGDVHRYGFPRTDLSVALDGVTIKPALALGGWVAFKPAHDGAMIMGDFVLLESEINPVMAKLIDVDLRSQPFTITCCAPTQRPSTCMSADTVIPLRWQPLFTRRYRQVKHPCRRQPPQHRHRLSISIRRNWIK
jgi:hypothetical protein